MNVFKKPQETLKGILECIVSVCINYNEDFDIPREWVDKSGEPRLTRLTEAFRSQLKDGTYTKDSFLKIIQLDVSEYYCSEVVDNSNTIFDLDRLKTQAEEAYKAHCRDDLTSKLKTGNITESEFRQKYEEINSKTIYKNSNLDGNPLSLKEKIEPEEIRKKLIEVPAGIEYLDLFIDNSVLIPFGALSVIAGRPGEGKTATMLNMAVCDLLEAQDSINEKKNKPPKTLFISLEESRESILCKLYGIFNEKKRKTGNWLSREEEKRAPFLELNNKDSNPSIFWDLIGRKFLHVVYGNYTISEIETLVLNAHSQGYNRIYLDYLQKVKPEKSNRERRQLEIADISGRLTNLAVRTDLPIVTGAQLNRESKKDKDGSPELFHLREAGDIEQDSSFVLAVSKNKDIKDKDILEYKVLKNRNGENGKEWKCDFLENRVIKENPNIQTTSGKKGKNK